ncbi:retrotransposon protein, putative, ty1-copia subclass [Tanacetum coccineum]
MFEKTSCCRKSTDLVVLYISFRQALKLQYALSGKTVTELHALLINFEKGLKDKAPTPQVFIIQKGRDNKPKPQANKKVKGKGNADKTSKKKSDPGAAVRDLKKKGNYLMGINICKWAMEHEQLLAHIGKTRMQKLHREGLLENIDEESFDKCESCISGKMTKKPFNKNIERATDLLGLIHTDVCGPLRHVSRKVFQEVELQLGKKIKALRSDRGGEYLSQEFKDYLSENGIVQNLTSPYTPQQNGVSERRNRTLLDMVRSMFNLTTLPLSFWDYALESAVRILNMVPTKKVDKTPYEIWHGKAPNLSYLKVWGCEAYVKRDSADKLQQRSVKCIFVGYPKETMGYYFYFPPENKVIVASRTLKVWVPPSELIPVRRSERTKRAPNRLCLNMEVEDDVVGDLGEPANYKTAMLDPDKAHSKTYGVSTRMTFSPVADIRAIRILIAIAAYYDYEIWQMDVKTAFLNGRLDEDIYMEQPEGYVKYKSIQNRDAIFKYYLGLKQASTSWNKRFDGNQKGEAAYIHVCKTLRTEFIPMEVKHDLSNEMCASSDEEKAYMKKNPRKLHWVAVKHILKYLRNTKDMFLMYGGNPDTELEVTVDWNEQKADNLCQCMQRYLSTWLPSEAFYNG